MKVLIAADSFKGSMSSEEVANNIETGIKRVWNSAVVEKILVADGGEGFTQAIHHKCGGKLKEVMVTNPMGENMSTHYLQLDDNTVVMEIAAASGITLIEKEKLNPLIATSYGTGELILKAVEEGAKRIVLGLGGSATNDAGVGILQALGFRFLDKDGNEVGKGGGQLKKIQTIDGTKVTDKVRNCKFILATDVRNPLTGKTGATEVFGRQKGATEEMVLELEEGMINYAGCLKNTCGTEVAEVPGTGAAGGVPGSMIALLDSSITSGLTVLFDLIYFENLLKDVDLVITGEGKLDFQSQFGKVPVGVAKRVKEYANIPVIAINGSVEGNTDWAYECGLDGIASTITSITTWNEVCANAENALISAAERTARLLNIK
jgi:glycerate kinase